MIAAPRLFFVPGTLPVPDRPNLTQNAWGVVSPSGGLLHLWEIAAMAATRNPETTIRRLRFVLFDESEHTGEDAERGGERRAEDGTIQKFRLRFRSGQYFKAAIRPLPLLFLKSQLQLPIGIVEGIRILPAGATPNTEGPHLIATARLHPSDLADVAWRAVHECILTHVFLHYQATARNPSTGDIVGADFVDVSLADSGVHMPAARLLEAYETPGLDSPVTSE